MGKAKFESKVETIVRGIWRDINGRKGYDLACLDSDIQKEIKDSWRKVVRTALAKPAVRK